MKVYYKTTFKLRIFLISIGIFMIFGYQIPNDPKEKEMTDKERRAHERTSDKEMEAKIDDLISKMTLEEKIGQMTQINNNMIAEEVNAATDPSAPPETLLNLDTAKVIEYLTKYKIGSFLNGIAVPAENWYEYSKLLQELNMRYSRLKIPMIYGVDHMHGANYLENSTIFPHSINIGATFQPQFSTDEAYVVGLETANLGHHWIFCPVVDIGRNPNWPRFYETYGEDPYVCSVMGAAYVKMLENHPETAPHKQVATAKHFIGYSDPDNGWDRTPATIDDQQLQEFFVPSFQALVDAGIKSFMINGGDINSVPVHASHKLLTKLLRDQMGFKGAVVTDWEDVIRLHKTHKVAKDMKEATYKAIMAGIDMSMTPYTTDFFGELKELVEEKRISMDRIDLSVARILRLKFQAGLFDNPYPGNNGSDKIKSPESVEKALNAARESLVLTKNEGILPLKSPKKIVLTGKNADSKKALAGGWTLRWIPTDEQLFPKDMHTVFTAMKKEFSGTKVELTDKAGLRKSAIDADAVVVVAGEEPYSETPGNIPSLELEKDQIELIKEAQLTGKPVVLIMVAGRPRLVTEVLDNCDAFIWAGLPGFEGGQAIAEVLSGQTNPSGKMSFTYPAFAGHWYPYNHKNMELFFQEDHTNRNAIANFGEGLSYTTFEYKNLKLSSKSISGKKTMTAQVTVTNTGDVEGKEAVLWYISDEVGTYTRPVKALKYFEKQHFKPGESKTFTFEINPEKDLSYPDEDGKKLIEPGDFTLHVGGLSEGFEYK
ncbi:glycoside hydrolase family 3 N-terminal domain-containing protein [Flexithrix dorotheae]|uniref:glycoside hydrolase family 3 N-terminal domain-containing protein n=1 Tax=Flexithrix dorotheae TaxID=70993 RepID=UPI00037B98AD|nr:glycoside hydrolase family 3 N-terminal domain-containing protein [Flexithrix dorotheae]